VTASQDRRLPSNDVDDVEDGYPSLEAFGDGGGPHTWETSDPPPEPEPKIEESEEEGLLLRERLARAGAGRKRPQLRVISAAPRPGRSSSRNRSTA
jgi:hypothetical protein